MHALYIVMFSIILYIDTTVNSRTFELSVPELGKETSNVNFYQMIMSWSVTAASYIHGAAHISVV